MIRPTRSTLLVCLVLTLVSSASGLASAEEPITPLPPPPQANPLKLALGERLFAEKRLSENNSRSCATCHDLKFNGATRVPFDKAPDGSSLPFNTPTVFNSALNFRLGWEGTHRTLEQKIAFTLGEPIIMNCPGEVCAQKLNADPAMRTEFEAVYGRGPDAANIVDALATFERSLITTGSRFDRWLSGETNALTEQELAGYRLFKSLGCIACHQGMMVGGNLFQRHGIFHPLARPDPEILRVPSLRNVATTAPYFHDGSARSLQIAVHDMAFAQLNSRLTDSQVDSIVSFLLTLTGTYRGRPLGVP
jgi:cytochrome c peroxidase